MVEQIDLTKEEVRGPRNLSRLLKQSLDSSHLELLRTVSAAASSQGIDIYVVGGFVRDLLLESVSVDYDLVVEGDAIKLGRMLTKNNGGSLTVHRRFGTAKWYLSAKLKSETGVSDLDLVSARTESYERPTALPEVKHGTINLDLHRRDFSVNTLAISLQSHDFGDLLDPWGGLKDIEEKCLRVLHSQSFVDDPTRVLRAVRLEQRLGFRLEDHTAELMDSALPLVDRVSGDRIWHEIEKTFGEESPETILARLDEIGVTGVLHSALSDQVDSWLVERFKDARERISRETLPVIYFALWLYRMRWKDIKAVSRRLKVTSVIMRVLQQTERVRGEIHVLKELSKPSEVARVLDGISKVTLLVIGLAEDESVSENIRRYDDKYRHVKPTFSGLELQERGVSHGPRIGAILRRVRSAWLDGDISDTAEEEELVQELLIEKRQRS